MTRRMKVTSLVIIAALACNLLVPASARAQANQSWFTTTGQDKQVRAEQQQRRRVKGRTLVSDILPPIRIKFDKDFKYVGSQSFTLYNSAQVEQFFFVAASGNRIKRVFMVQFEGYLPNNTHTYKYEISNT